MSTKVIHYTVHLQVPPVKIAVTFGDVRAEAAINKYGCYPHVNKDELLAGIRENAGTFCGLHNEKYPMLIALPEEYEPVITAHECLHAAVAVHDHIGSNIKLPDNDEVIAYTMDALHREIADLYAAHVEANS
jgi:hypothetical protein